MVIAVCNDTETQERRRRQNYYTKCIELNRQEENMVAEIKTIKKCN
jgi:hypothetical protein